MFFTNNSHFSILQGPKFISPAEFVDEAALSPPDGYKDNGIKNSLGGALSGHIFGAQHLQQLQVIQRLQQQRAAMLAARNSNQTPQSQQGTSINQQIQKHPQQSQQQNQLPQTLSQLTHRQDTTQNQQPTEDDLQLGCTECAECAECAASKLHDAGKFKNNLFRYEVKDIL